MGKMREESDCRSQLVMEICTMSSISATCAHHRHTKKPSFVDWYLLLQIDQDAGVDAIRRRYHQLALQLHPDKNNHPKAEVAFKLVSEAYSCLSDDAKRTAFDYERQISFCKECSRKPKYQTHKFHNILNKEKLNRCNTMEQARSYKVLQATKEARQRFKEEARVIETCLRSYQAFGREHPIFNPFNPPLFQGYPHQRTQILKKPKDFMYLHTGNEQNYKHGRGKLESPIFEIRL
ncbi:uncharacterized protein LOC143887187 [Tasmannia lanceolata]|uniref:uncharacterized protein LOC143887187 n=1 Tax=Tasmannia lanceolata TaxID=3420 RepID=UPI0040627D8C